MKYIHNQNQEIQWPVSSMIYNSFHLQHATCWEWRKPSVTFSSNSGALMSNWFSVAFCVWEIRISRECVWQGQWLSQEETGFSLKAWIANNQHADFKRSYMFMLTNIGVPKKSKPPSTLWRADHTVSPGSLGTLGEALAAPIPMSAFSTQMTGSLPVASTSFRSGWICKSLLFCTQ